jgi:hypothetical protein
VSTPAAVGALAEAALLIAMLDRVHSVAVVLVAVVLVAVAPVAVAPVAVAPVGAALSTHNPVAHTMTLAIRSLAVTGSPFPCWRKQISLLAQTSRPAHVPRPHATFFSA